MLLIRVVLIGLGLLAGCTVQVPPAEAQCVGTTCGSSLTAYLTMCRVSGSCNKQDLLDNLNNNFIDIDLKFAPTTLLQGHGHRGTNGDGPLLDPSAALACSDSPSEGECLTWNTGTGQCEWDTCATGTGSGDVVGPSSAVDRSVAIYDGTTGQLIKDNGEWTINTVGTLGAVATSGTANLVLNAQCNGAKTATQICAGTADSSTTTGNNLTRIAHSISSTGTMTGTGTRSIGLAVSADGGVQNIAVSATGDVTVSSGSVGIGDVTPDALLDVVATASTNTVPAILGDCSGAQTTSQSCVNILSSATSSTANIANIAQNISIVGTWNGSGTSKAVGTFYDVDSSVITNPYAIWVQTGDLVLASEDNLMGLGDTTPDYQLEVENTAGLVTPFGVTVTGARATAAPAAVISNTATGGDGASTKRGLQITNTGTYSGDNIGIDVTTGGGTMIGAKYTVTGTAGGTATGLSIPITNSANDSHGLLMTVATTGTTKDADGLDVTATSATGDAFGASFIAQGGGAGRTAVALTLAADNADVKMSLLVNTGDVVFGPSGITEDLRWNQANSQFIINVDSGVATDVGANTIELHNNVGEVGLRVYAAGSAGNPGAGISVQQTGALTSASAGGLIVANTQTSSTNSINKAGATFTSTGTWSGTSAINSAIAASASGGTNNYALWAQLGLIVAQAGGASADYVKVGGILHVDTTTIGNITTGEDDLSTYTLPAATLNTNGDSITFTAAGTMANNGNAKTIKIYLGTTVVGTYTGFPNAALDWTIVGECYRTGAATQKCHSLLSDNSSTTNAAKADYATATETLSGALTVKLTGEGTGTNDVVEEIFKVGWMPANT
mgnify:FL=1